jgi:integrase/recombinase XerD
MVTTNIPTEVRDFLNYKVVELGISEKTQESYCRTLRQLCSSLGPETGPTQVEEHHLKQYLFKHKQNPRTIRHHISVLREFFKFLQRDGLIRRDPMARIESPKMWKRLPRYMAEIDVQQLIDAPGPIYASGPNSLSSYRLYFRNALILRDRAICETLYAGGIRVSELISAKLLDLKLADGLLTVFGKGSKERIAPLGRPAVDALRAYLNVARPLLQQRGKVSPYLLVGLNTPHLTRQAVCYLLRGRAKRAGIGHVHPHMLRHSCATHMLDNGANLRVIQEILGHADISTTEIYTHVSAERATNAFLTCHPRNNPIRTQMELFQPVAPVLTPGPVMCTQCRAPVCEGSKNLCEVHSRLNNAASNDSHKRAYAQKKLDTICANCDQPAVKGRVQCERHLRLAREAAKRFLEKAHSKRLAA